ncbi:MAG: dehydrogenase, partial [Chloroflexi bacterium]|nr:dehydrogenase [Chloroflexota bacterium]
GIASWSLVGKQFGVDTPLMRSFVDIGSIVIGFDGWESARKPQDLGIDGMDREALKTFLETGKQ